MVAPGSAVFGEDVSSEHEGKTLLTLRKLLHLGATEEAANCIEVLGLAEPLFSREALRWPLKVSEDASENLLGEVE
tara:strand:+ start:609 stop:836 length:228 start_codon:yes stop_codon:yes gene_type:complete